jgi:hypothetical protein
MPEIALYAQLTISLAHSSAITSGEIRTGTFAVAKKATTSCSLRPRAVSSAPALVSGPITRSPRPWCRTTPGPGIAVAT